MPESKFQTIDAGANSAAANNERVVVTDFAPTAAESTKASENDAPLSFSEFKKKHDDTLAALKDGNGIVAFVTAEYEQSKSYRLTNGIDTALMNALYARRGQYAGDSLASIVAINGSLLYDRILTECCRSAETYINDAISSDGTPWRFVAQRQNTIPKHQQEAFKNRVMSEWIEDCVKTGQVPNPEDTIDMVEEKFEDELKAIHEQNESKIRRMEDLCYDQFREGGGWRAIHEFIKDLCMFKVGCIEGPIASVGYKLDFVGNQRGTRKPVSNKVKQYRFSRISPFDLFPSPGNATMAGGNLNVRKPYTAKELLDCLGEDGWNDEGIRFVVSSYGEPGYQYITSFDSVRYWMEEHGTWTGARKGLIETLNFWGYVKGSRLTNSGVKADSIDPEAWYHIHAIVCGSTMLFCSILDDRYDIVPYFSDSFARIAGSAWGEGIADLIDDKEKMACACVRSLADNMAFASGPIEIVDPDQIPSGQAITNPTPRMVIQISPKPGVNSKPVEFQLIPSNAEALLKVSDVVRARAYDTIGMAPPDMGTDRAAGAGRTSTGLEELFSHRNRGIRAVVYSIDTNIGRPMFSALYLMNMLYNDDESIKAPCDIEPQGILAAIAREQAGGKQISFLQTVATPNSLFAKVLTNRGLAMAGRQLARAVMLNDAIFMDDHTAAELDKAQDAAMKAQEQAMQQQAQQPMQQEQAQPQPQEAQVA